jgi:hypothetical protein
MAATRLRLADGNGAPTTRDPSVQTIEPALAGDGSEVDVDGDRAALRPATAQFCQPACPSRCCRLGERSRGSRRRGQDRPSSVPFAS